MCEGPGACDVCGRRLRLIDGWYLDATEDADVSAEHRRRVRGFDRRWAAPMYDFDVRVTSRPIWGASFRTQIDFNVAALEYAADLGLPYLDVAVGTGLMLRNALARATRAPTTVVVDLSVPMLDAAHRYLGDTASYVRATVEALPFRTGAFGVVHSANGLHLFPSTSDACEEIVRVVSSGGATFATAWTDEGSTIANRYKRLLRRLGSINELRPASYYTAALEASGLTPRTEGHVGSLFMWSGSKE